MAFFRSNNNWLRFRVKYRIRNNHPDLFEPNLKSTLNKFKDFISAKEQWWIILSTVILIFAICPLLSFHPIDFVKISDETARQLVDQRTTNIATIISITLVVVGFLINNLAVKSSLTYRLLFKKSLLFPTIYLTLSTIACFIITSTLRDTTMQYFDFSGTVLAGTYLVFVILFLIGFLFRTIIQFTNEKRIATMLHDQLMKEAKINMKENLIRKYSGEEYLNTVKLAGAQMYSFADLSDLIAGIEAIESPTDEIKAIQPSYMILYDINLTKIKRFIERKRKKSEKVLFRKLEINTLTTEKDNFIWDKEISNSKKNKNYLKGTLELRNPPSVEQDSMACKKYFENKIEEMSEESKYKSLLPILESYLQLYELQMKNQK
jgi:hypothetical protein